MAASPKRTYFHITVQNYEKVGHHFLVPRLSEVADNDDVTVSAVERPASAECRRIVVERRIADGTSPESSRDRDGTDPDRVRSARFAVAMRPSGYSECVSVTEGPPAEDRSVTTFCDLRPDRRFKESVDVGPTLTPVGFQSAIVCHATTSKKNYRTSASYVPRMRPVRFEATQYTRPRRAVTTYVSHLDYIRHDNQTWYTSALHLAPSSCHHNTILNFGARADVAGVGDDVAGGVSVDVNRNAVKASAGDFRQPTLLVSSGPEDGGGDGAPARMSHRSKMVVAQAAPARHLRDEDYVVYVNAYSGDAGCRLNDGAVQNGYLSDDVTDV